MKEEIPVFDLDEEVPKRRDFKPYVFIAISLLSFFLLIYKIGFFLFLKCQLNRVEAELAKYEHVRQTLADLQQKREEVRKMVYQIEELNALKERDFEFFSAVPALASSSLKFQSLNKRSAKIILSGVALSLDSYRGFLSRLDKMEGFRNLEKQKYVEGSFVAEVFLRKGGKNAR